MPSEAPLFDRYVVPTNHLAEVINPLLDQLDDAHEVSPTNHVQDAGPFAEIYARMSRYTRIAEKSVPRRLYSIRRAQSLTTLLDIADPLLLCLGTKIDDVDLPVLPANPASARAMVETHYPDMPERERRKLARSLHRFSVAYVDTSADPYTLEYLAEQNEKRNRRLERKEELVAA